MQKNKMQKSIAKNLLAGFLMMLFGLSVFYETADARGSRESSNSGMDLWNSIHNPENVQNYSGDPTAQLDSRVTGGNGGRSIGTGLNFSITNLLRNIKKAKVRNVSGVFQGYVELGKAEKSALEEVSSGATHMVIFKKGNTIYTAYVNSSTRVVNRKGEAMSLSDFVKGNKISVRGSVSGAKIYKVKKVRNIKFPVVTN